MDNVVLETEFNFSECGKVINFPKRIKLSEKSHGNVCAKIASHLSLAKKESTSKIVPFPQASLEQSNLTSPEKESTDKVIPFPQVNLNQSETANDLSKTTVTEQQQESEEDNTVLGNVNLVECSQYVGQTLTNLYSRLIRLTDAMYTKVVAYTSMVKKETSATLSEFSDSFGKSVSEDTEPFVSTDNGVDLTSDKMKSTVDNAFDSIPVETVVKEANNGVKKASYPKAKVKKYKLPTKMISDNGLFTSDVVIDTTTVSNSIKEVSDREVPIVVPERKDKFLFNDLSIASVTTKDSEEPKKMDFSIDELKSIRISSEKDDDFEALLAKVEKSRKDEEVSRTKKVSAEKDFESSVQVLKTAAQRYNVSNKALEEVKAKAHAYLNEIEANIEDNMKKERELRAMAEQQIQEARKIEAVADKNEAHIEQFNSVLAIGTSSLTDNSTKTYSRSHSSVA